MKTLYFKIAGILNLLVALVHIVAGQMDLINPLMESDFDRQHKSKWWGIWHVVTILLIFTSFLILRVGFGTPTERRMWQLQPIGVLYLLIGVPFIISSLWLEAFAPQWIILMPIGALVFLGLNKNK